MAQTHNIITATPVMANAGAYSANDCLGTVFAIDLKEVYGGGVFSTVSLYDDAAQSAQIDLLLFNANPTASTSTDNGAFSLHANDKAKLLGAIKIATASSDYSAVGADVVVTNTTRNLPFDFGSTADGKLYGLLIIREGSKTFANGDIQLRFGVLV